LPSDYQLEPVDAYLMTEMLRAVVQEGTGGRAKELGRPVAGKTGTTNDLHDAWFIGYSPEIAAGVWIGYDNARKLGLNETGGRASAPIFVDYLKHALRDRPVQDFVAPEGVVFARVDRATGLLAQRPTAMPCSAVSREGMAPLEMSPATDGRAARLRPSAWTRKVRSGVNPRRTASEENSLRMAPLFASGAAAGVLGRAQA
jgi:penicillin-binding protein 1A